MFRLGKTRPLPGHSSIESIKAKTTSFWLASTHQGVQQGRQCAGHLAKTREDPPSLPGVHAEYNAIASGRGSNGKAWAKGNAKESPGHHFPPYGTPPTGKMRVGEPKVLVTKGSSPTKLGWNRDADPTATYMVFKATVNDRRTTSPLS
ncbi:hypothetical protein TNCV_3316551 [Trichonephila clavipes]|nr:hypothetical protein TNCV_3316551 [Trichonephila clavipes]